MSTPSPTERRSLLRALLTLRHPLAKRGVVVLLFGTLLTLALAGVRPNGNAKGARSRAMPVEVVAVQRGASYRMVRDFTGEILARRSSDLGFELPGTVIELQVDEGDEVQKGQALAGLDTRRIRAQQQRLEAQRAEAILGERLGGPRPETIAMARARVAERQVDLELACRKKAKWQDLFARGAASKEERDDAVSAEQAAAARLDQASEALNELLAGTRAEHIAAQRALVRQLEAQLAAVEVDLSNSELKAPFAGRIARRLVDEGTVVPAGQQVLRLVEHRHLEARIGVGVDTAAALPVGAEVNLTCNGDTIAARVQAHLPEIDPATRTLTIVLRIAEPAASQLHPGQIVRLPVEQTVEQDGAWLPNTALLRAELGLWSCYVVEEDPCDQGARQRVRRCSVEVLHSEARRSYVRGLLADGDRVVAGGVQRIAPGQRVEITEAGQPR